MGLSIEQGARLATARRRRSLALAAAKSTKARLAAEGVFDESVRQILTEAQQKDLGEVHRRIKTDLAAVLAAEARVLARPGTPPSTPPPP